MALARGASSLLGLVSAVSGQGGMGLWVAKSGAGAARATGATAFLVTTNGLALAAVAAVGLAAARALPVAGRVPGGVAVATAGVLSGGAAYLAAVAVAPLARPPPWPALRAALAPLAEAGVPGHLRAAAWRLPHMLAMVLFHWGALRLWGMSLPLAAGFALLPLVLFVAAMPVTPSGLGTTQAAQVLLLAPWAAGATSDERAADVLAFSLAFYAVSLVAQAVVGLACLGLLQAGVAGPRRPGEGR